MSKVLAKVPSRTTFTPYVSATCNVCRGGWGISENGVETHPQNRQYIGQKCSCGGTYEEESGRYTNRQIAYTKVECDCGKILHCSGFTTTCSCGADYNWNGTRLAPRSEWETEYDF